LKPIGSTVKLSSSKTSPKKKPKAKRKGKPVKLTKKRSA